MYKKGHTEYKKVINKVLPDAFIILHLRRLYKIDKKGIDMTLNQRVVGSSPTGETEITRVSAR